MYCPISCESSAPILVGWRPQFHFSTILVHRRRLRHNFYTNSKGTGLNMLPELAERRTAVNERSASECGSKGPAKGTGGKRRLLSPPWSPCGGGGSGRFRSRINRIRAHLVRSGIKRTELPLSAVCSDCFTPAGGALFVAKAESTRNAAAGSVCKRWERVSCRLAFEVEVEADNERSLLWQRARPRGTVLRQRAWPTADSARMSAV